MIYNDLYYMIAFFLIILYIKIFTFNKILIIESNFNQSSYHYAIHIYDSLTFED